MCEKKNDARVYKQLERSLHCSSLSFGAKKVLDMAGDVADKIERHDDGRIGYDTHTVEVSQR